MDKATSGPTPTQLANADLVAVTSMNGKPIRSWDPVAQNFPPTTAYATPLVPVTPLYSVTFANTQGQSYPALSLKAGAYFTVPPAPTSAPAGETFADWGDGAHTYLPGATYVMPAKNVIMTSIFAPVVTPPPPPPPSGTIPAMPTTAPSGYTIANSQSFAGLSGCPSGWFLYSGPPGGQPQAWWLPSLVKFNPNFVSLIAQGPMTLPNGNQGYEAGGIGCNSFGQVFGRWDFCVRLSPNAAAMSAIGLLWPDADPRPWPEAGESDGLETWGRLANWLMTEHYGTPTAQKNPQNALTFPPGFDPTQFFVFSIIREAGKTTCLINGVQAGQVVDPNIPATQRFLDFQYQYTGVVGTDNPVTPCPYDVAWAVQYAPAV